MKATIHITLYDGTVPVLAEVHGQWAIHYGYCGKDWQTGEHTFYDQPRAKAWQITHIPTGLSVRTNLDRLRDAKQIVTALESYPHTITDQKKVPHDDLRQLHRFVSAAERVPGLTWQRFVETECIAP